MNFRLFLVTFFLVFHLNAEEVKTMSTDSKMPPQVMAYISGANTSETKDFDFLIGSWDVERSKLLPDGSHLDSKGTWEARYINDKRMVVDEFKAFSPDGSEVSFFVTLRSYSPISKRWHFSSLAAMVPPEFETHEWYGNMEDDEMVLHIIGKMPDGRIGRCRIRFFEIMENTFKWQNKISFDEG